MRLVKGCNSLEESSPIVVGGYRWQGIGIEYRDYCMDFVAERFDTFLVESSVDLLVSIIL